MTTEATRGINLEHTVDSTLVYCQKDIANDYPLSAVEIKKKAFCVFRLWVKCLNPLNTALPHILKPPGWICGCGLEEFSQIPNLQLGVLQQAAVYQHYYQTRCVASPTHPVASTIT